MKMPMIVSALALAAALGGCAQYQPGYSTVAPQNGPQSVSYGTVAGIRFVRISTGSAVPGALVGGVLGAGIGSVIHNTNGALAGGLLGALGGGAIGASQTRLGQELTIQLSTGSYIAIQIELHHGQPPYQVGEHIEVMSGNGQTEVTPLVGG